MSDEIEAHILKKYEILQKLGKRGGRMCREGSVWYRVEVV
jgi:hypothetical protein